MVFNLHQAHTLPTPCLHLTYTMPTPDIHITYTSTFRFLIGKQQIFDCCISISTSKWSYLILQRILQLPSRGDFATQLCRRKILQRIQILLLEGNFVAPLLLFCPLPVKHKMDAQVYIFSIISAKGCRLDVGLMQAWCRLGVGNLFGKILKTSYL